MDIKRHRQEQENTRCPQDLCVQNSGECGENFDRTRGRFKVLLTEKLETTKKLDETILELTKPKELEKEIEDSGEFCEHVYSILAKIDTRFEFGERETWRTQKDPCDKSGK